MKQRLRQLRRRWRCLFEQNVEQADRELQRHRRDTTALHRRMDRLVIESEALRNRTRERGRRT